MPWSKSSPTNEQPSGTPAQVPTDVDLSELIPAGTKCVCLDPWHALPKHVVDLLDD